MNFSEIAKNRQSCRSYNPERSVEDEKIRAIIESASLSPSACNGQPYFITVCRGDAAARVAKAVGGMGMNGFALYCPIMLVISEEGYVPSAAIGAKIKKNDYRSIDIGILAAYITAEATAQGLGSCIIGWLDDKKIREVCGVKGAVRLVISLGYPKDDTIRAKKRKKISDLAKEIG